jgi:hypothetical protein
MLTPRNHLLLLRSLHVWGWVLVLKELYPKTVQSPGICSHALGSGAVEEKSEASVHKTRAQELPKP